MCIPMQVVLVFLTYIFAPSQHLPIWIAVWRELLAGNSTLMSPSYFLTLAGTILCGLSIGIGLLYLCIKSDPCCFRVLYLGDIVGHVGWIFYGSIHLREAFSMWSNDQSRCSHLIMITSAATLGVTALYMAILVIVTLLAIVCGCYFKCCGSGGGVIKGASLRCR